MLGVENGEFVVQPRAEIKYFSPTSSTTASGAKCSVTLPTARLLFAGRLLGLEMAEIDPSMQLT